MTTPVRNRLSIALAAVAISALSLPAMAQSWADTPNFLESWAGEAEVAPANVDEPETTAIRVKTQRPDPEAPAESVEVAATVAEDERAKPRRLPAIIDQYPQNPRCYVAGQYVPAPPLCPN